MSVVVIIPSGGVGKRFGGEIPKQYQVIAGAPVIIHTLMNFEAVEEISSVIIACAVEWRNFLQEQKEKFSLKKELFFTEAGSERQHSVSNALQIDAVRNAETILVHDAVRPFASPGLIKKIIAAAIEYGAAIPGLPSKETVKIIDEKNFVDKTPARVFIRNVQTPQGFQRGILLHSYEKAQKENFLGTDDASLVENAGYPVIVVDGEENNIKLTAPLDLKLAEIIFSQRHTKQ